MLNIHPLQAALEALALDVTPDKVARCLRLLDGDGKIRCPLCARNLADGEIPSLIVSGENLTCSNPKCLAAGNVVDLVTLTTGLPRHEAVGIVMKIKADQPVDLPNEPDESTRDTPSFDSNPEADNPQRDATARVARDEVRAEQVEGVPENENINALIWSAQAKNAVIAPNDVLKVYIHQVGCPPLLDKGGESLLGREVREHREAYIALMLKLDPILLQVAAMLEDVVEQRCPPSHVLAPTPSLNGNQPITRRSVRSALNAIRRYEQLRDEVYSAPFSRKPLSYRNATVEKFIATRKGCVNKIIALELRKSVLWDLHKRCLVLLEARCHNEGKAVVTVDDDLPFLARAPSEEVVPVALIVLLKNLRYHFSEHVRCMQDLACHNLRLAIQIAIKYRRSGLPVEDLIQAANFGLLAACERFDERHGARFSTYATWWIRQAICREIDNSCTLIRLPSNLRRALRDLRGVHKRQLPAGRPLSVP